MHLSGNLTILTFSRAMDQDHLGRAYGLSYGGGRVSPSGGKSPVVGGGGGSKV